MTWYVDPSELRRQYSDDERLRIRFETHRRFGRNRVSAPQLVLERLEAGPGMLVADVCCGPGDLYHPRLRELGARVIGIDLSLGMVRRAASGCWPVRADAQALPLADASCDRVMCNHALYHVPDQLLALRELRRVVRPGGRVVLATNSGRSMRQLTEAGRRAAADLGRPFSEYRGDRSSPFVLEDVERVREVFPGATVHEVRNQLVFSEAEPVVRYVATMGIDPDFAAALTRRVQEVIEDQGVFTVDTIAGCFVADA
jgi:ubiquinone/menaquinone biosynthesis C-methylase UbiE